MQNKNLKTETFEDWGTKNFPGTTTGILIFEQPFRTIDKEKIV
ncbi:MAG: hypothetical protein RIM68_09760 [Arenibacter sp.]